MIFTLIFLVCNGITYIENLLKERNPSDEAIDQVMLDAQQASLNCMYQSSKDSMLSEDITTRLKYAHTRYLEIAETFLDRPGIGAVLRDDLISYHSNVFCRAEDLINREKSRKKLDDEVRRRMEEIPDFDDFRFNGGLDFFDEEM